MFGLWVLHECLLKQVRWFSNWTMDGQTLICVDVSKNDKEPKLTISRWEENQKCWTQFLRPFFTPKVDASALQVLWEPCLSTFWNFPSSCCLFDLSPPPPPPPPPPHHHHHHPEIRRGEMKQNSWFTLFKCYMISGCQCPDHFIFHLIRCSFVTTLEFNNMWCSRHKEKLRNKRHLKRCSFLCFIVKLTLLKICFFPVFSSIYSPVFFCSFVSSHFFFSIDLSPLHSYCLLTCFLCFLSLLL